MKDGVDFLKIRSQLLAEESRGIWAPRPRRVVVVAAEQLPSALALSPPADLLLVHACTEGAEGEVIKPF